MTNRARRDVEKEFGPIREGLISRLQAGMTPHDIGKEWGVHFNTVRTWMRDEQIERRVIYAVRDSEPAGAGAR